MRFELKHGSLTAAVESHGGELVSLRDGSNTEYIWGGDPAFWSGRNPHLFPFVGNLKNGSVTFKGQSYQMGRHGFARNSEFSVAEQGEDYIVLELRDSQATRALYPYAFCLRICHRLTENGFSTTFRVENTGDEPLPFCIGAHTAFRCPIHEGERFEDYEIVFDREETVSMTLLTADGLISHHLREPLLDRQDRFTPDRSVFARLDTIILERLRSTGVSLLHKESGRGLRMDFPGFPMLAFWTKGDKEAPFICLEPWHGCAAVDNESGLFEDKPHCIVLQPGSVKVLTYTVTLKSSL